MCANLRAVRIEHIENKNYLDYWDDVIAELRDVLPPPMYAEVDMNGLKKLFAFFGKWANDKLPRKKTFPFALAARWLGTLRVQGGYLGN